MWMVRNTGSGKTWQLAQRAKEEVGTLRERPIHSVRLQLDTLVRVMGSRGGQVAGEGLLLSGCCSVSCVVVLSWLVICEQTAAVRGNHELIWMVSSHTAYHIVPSTAYFYAEEDYYRVIFSSCEVSKMHGHTSIHWFG